MLFRKTRGKEFKMIWSVEKDGRRSFLAGTAHFFPHSFKDSLAIHLQQAETVIFEGPSMKRAWRRLRGQAKIISLNPISSSHSINEPSPLFAEPSAGGLGDRFQFMDCVVSKTRHMSWSKA
jgi:hypothetical protein